LSACSFIARNNLNLLTDSLGIVVDIARGDAADLVKFGRVYETLTSFSDKDELIAALYERYDAHIETVFDVYRFVGRRPVGLQ